MIETTTVTQRRGNRKMLYLFEQYKAAHPGEGNEIKPHLVAPLETSANGSRRSTPPTFVARAQE